MAEKWFSVAEVAKQAQVPESTTRRYMSRFERFFRYDERSRGRRYHPESVAIVVFIQGLYAEGLEAEEIEEALSKQFSIAVEVPSTIEPSAPPTLATKKDIEVFLQSLQNEIALIREENARLHHELDKRMAERDKRLMEVMQQMLETRKEIAASETKQKKWYQFWK